MPIQNSFNFNKHTVKYLGKYLEFISTMDLESIIFDSVFDSGIPLCNLKFEFQIILPAWRRYNSRVAIGISNAAFRFGLKSLLFLRRHVNQVFLIFHWVIWVAQAYIVSKSLSSILWVWKGKKLYHPGIRRFLWFFILSLTLWVGWKPYVVFDG